MKSHRYKTNHLLWVVFAVLFLLLSSYDIQFIFGLFTGSSRAEDLLSFEFIAPLVFSIVMGWLGQCAAIIVFGWIREKHKS